LTASKKGALNLEIRLEREKDALTRADGDMLLMSGQVMDQDDSLRGPGGAHMKFEAQLKAINKGGSVKTDKNFLVVKNASELTLLFTAATDYNLEKLNFDRSVNPAETVKPFSKAQRIRSSVNQKLPIYRKTRPLLAVFRLTGVTAFSNIPTWVQG
jgi:alpha-L-fucosidase 2